MDVVVEDLPSVEVEGDVHVHVIHQNHYVSYYEAGPTINLMGRKQQGDNPMPWLNRGDLYQL